MEAKADNDLVVTCEVCSKEFPPAEAESATTDEFVRHFCGVDCYEYWIANRKKEELD